MSLLVRLCPSVCENSHFAVLLGAYGASLSVLGEGTGPRSPGPGGCGSGWAWGPGNVIQGSMALGGVGTGGLRGLKGTRGCGASVRLDQASPGIFLNLPSLTCRPEDFTSPPGV